MEIIQSKEKKLNFIAGIFYNKDDSEKFLSKIPPEEINQFEIISLPLEFPFYIIEKDNGFKFLTKTSEIKDELNQITPSDDEETHYFNLYVIKNNFEPKNAGTDWMGSLTHFHIDNDFFKRDTIKNLLNKIQK